MDTRKKLIDLIMKRMNWEILPGAEHKIMIYANLEELVDALIAGGVTVREMRKPLQRGKLVDYGFFFFERKEEEEVSPVVLREGWEVFFVDFVGTDSLIRHDKADYGKNWRCWAEKPTEEERKAAEWLY